MMADEIYRGLTHVQTWNDPSNAEVRAAFVAVMRKKQYGGDALQFAWEFYLHGWNGAWSLFNARG